jgi:hypothetical protein
MLIPLHRERTAKIDLAAIAKGKRLARSYEDFRRRMLAKEPGKSPRPPSRWPRRKMQRRRQT